MSTRPIRMSNDTGLKGVFRLAMGKRRVIISLSKLDAELGIVPSDDDCRQAMNDCSSHGDAVAGPLTPVYRMDTGSMLRR